MAVHVVDGAPVAPHRDHHPEARAQQRPQLATAARVHETVLHQLHRVVRLALAFHLDRKRPRQRGHALLLLLARLNAGGLRPVVTTPGELRWTSVDNSHSN